MASGKRTTRRTTVVEESPDETTDQVVTEAPEDDPETDETLKDFLEKLGPGTITFKVFRATTKGLEFAFNGEDEFDEETLQQMYPQGGKFVVRVYRNNKYVSPSHQIRIAPKPYHSGDQASSGNSGGNQGYEMQLTLMRDQMQRQHEMIMAMVTKGNGNQQQMTPLDMVQMLVQMKQLQPDTNLDVLMKGIELAREVGGSSDTDWKTEALKIAKDVGPALLAGAARPNPTPASTPTPLANPVPGPDRNTNPQPTPEESNDMQTQIKMGIALLKKKCEQRVSPEFFIDQALVFADTEMYQRLITTIVSNDFDSFAQQVDPSIAQPPYRDWFMKVFDGIKKEFTDYDETDDNMDGNSSGDAGDAPDIGNDGGTIPTGNVAS